MDFKAETVCKMQDYIRINTAEQITLSALASAVGYSPWYCYRLFLQYTGHSPSDYIRKLKLSSSALKLRDERIKVTDAAFDAGYFTPESYTRAFYKEFGLNPKEYALNPVMIPLFHPFNVEFKEKEQKTMKTTVNIFITVTEKPARKVIIKRGIRATNYFDYCGEVGCDIWGKLLSIKSVSPEPVSMWLPKKLIKPDTSEYVQGTEVEADYKGEIPEGFDIIDLPAAKYLMFQGEPFEDENYCEAIDALWEAEKKYDPKILGYIWDDKNPRIQLEPRGERGYIEFLPVQSV
ncbi:MAG: helix-turn-helix domain-containing protein [Firmicutes bacterium]|nr:helix-turn-helix domain-containing protein [Bacillota bacterium]